MVSLTVRRNCVEVIPDSNSKIPKKNRAISLSCTAEPSDVVSLAVWNNCLAKLLDSIQLKKNWTISLSCTAGLSDVVSLAVRNNCLVKLLDSVLIKI